MIANIINPHLAAGSKVSVEDLTGERRHAVTTATREQMREGARAKQVRRAFKELLAAE